MQRKQAAILASSLFGFSLAITGCSTANSQPNNPGHGMIGHGEEHHMGDKMHQWGNKMKGGMMGERMAALNLTDAQKAQVQQLRSQNQAKMQQLHATLKQYDDNIAAQKKAGANTATLLALYQQKQAVMQQAMTLRQQQEQQFISILTPEQQLKFYESREHRMPGREHDNHMMNGNQPELPQSQQPMPPHQ